MSLRGPIAAWILLAFALFPVRGSETLSQRIEAFIEAQDYPHANWGILVVDLASGGVVYGRDADQLFAPASTAKLFTVAAALDEFGADHRFVTPVYRVGSVDESGQLNGDLVIVASGDLTMGGRDVSQQALAITDTDHTYANGNDRAELTAPDPLSGLYELARQVSASGIRSVQGEVVIDDRLFDSETSTGTGPKRITPIKVNDNLIDVLVVPTTIGEPATVRWRPHTSTFRIDAKVQTVEAGRDTDVRVSTAGRDSLIVRGQIPRGHQPLVRIFEVPSPASFARTLFIECLKRIGVEIDASPLAGNPINRLPLEEEYATLPRVAQLISVPFSENMRLILKTSHNLHASTLPLIVAARHEKRTLEEGLSLQHDFLQRVGVDVDAISLASGDGGSQADYVTPRATVQLLQYMATRPDFQVYRNALPVLGVDGTLLRVLPDSPMRGHVQAKTGALFWRNVMNGSYLLTSKSLAGYMTTSQGHRLAFALFVSNVHLHRGGDTAEVGRNLGRLCEILFREL